MSVPVREGATTRDALRDAGDCAQRGDHKGRPCAMLATVRKGVATWDGPAPCWRLCAEGQPQGVALLPLSHDE